MTTDLSRLCARVLELDAAATPGPWREHMLDDFPDRDSIAIAEYRTAAPVLARALLEAHEEIERLREVLAEIRDTEPGRRASPSIDCLIGEGAAMTTRINDVVPCSFRECDHPADYRRSIYVEHRRYPSCDGHGGMRLERTQLLYDALPVDEPAPPPASALRAWLDREWARIDIYDVDKYRDDDALKDALVRLIGDAIAATGRR